MKGKLRCYLATALAAALMFSAVPSGFAMAEETNSTSTFIDDCTSLNKTASHSNNLQVFSNHPESGLSVISKTDHEEGWVRYAPQGMIATALELKFQAATGFFSLTGSVRVEVKTADNGSYTAVTLTQTGSQTLNATFQQITATAALPANVVDVRITLIGINWTVMLDQATLTLGVNSRVAFYQNLIQQESAWLLTLQLENGAIGMTNDTSLRKINPYFAEITCLALLDSGNVYAPQVKNYMDWHFAHLNTAATDRSGVDGTIYDYLITAGANNAVVSETVSTDSQGVKQYDSTDSYAALFLSVLWRYYEETGNASYLTSHASDIGRIVGVIFATMYNGLTQATPDHNVQYLMDNAEVYEGLGSAAKIYEQVLIPFYAAGTNERTAAEAKLSQITSGRSQIASKVESVLWKESGGYYVSSCTYSLFPAAFSWSQFYPSATCQAFAITCGLIPADGERAKRIWNNFNSYWSTGQSDHSWESLDIPDTFYWGVLPYAAALVGDVGRVNMYMNAYAAGPGATHAYPLYNADCAQAVRAAHVMLAYYNAA